MKLNFQEPYLINMKIVSWNINGIRSKSMNLFNKKQWNSESHLATMIKEIDPDIIAFNEIKCSEEHTEQFNVPLEQYSKIWNCSEKKGYAGTAIFTKVEPLSTTLGIDTLPEPDTEGRAITIELESLYVVATYVPNSGRSPERAQYRATTWDKCIQSYISKLEETKPVCWIGDLNVAHTSQDVHNVPKKAVPGFLPEERTNFKSFLQDSKLIDCYRHVHPYDVAYTWWDYRTRARQSNKGWRIDYTMVSETLKDKIVDSRILDKVLGSDHCPVYLKLDVSP